MTAHRCARRAFGALTAATLAIGLPVLAHTTSAGAAPPPPDDIITEPTWINGKIGKFEARFPADPAFPSRRRCSWSDRRTPSTLRRAATRRTITS